MGHVHTKTMEHGLPRNTPTCEIHLACQKCEAARVCRPSLAFPLSSTYKLTTQRNDPGTPGGTTSSDSTYNVKSGASAFDLGLAIGCGMISSLKRGSSFLTCGSLPILFRGQAGRQDKKNYCIAFMIGYAYKF